MGARELYSGALSPSYLRCTKVIVYVKSLVLPLFPTLGTHMKSQDEILFLGGRVVTPSVLYRKSFTKTRHEHHVYVLMHVIECVDKFLVT